ncbi:hypothetical protein ACOMHN_025643 [Nucella lapillus]
MSQPSTLLPIVEHVLQNNVFSFDGQMYRQIRGTTMSTPMAPAIANLFMGWLERRLLTTSPWSVEQELWRRFIDDILLLWTQGEERLQLFHQWLNQQHDTIKFTANYGRTSVHYLDVSISMIDGTLATDLYTKPTDCNMLLPFHSCHPRHCLRAIPFGQCIRLRRICSDEDKFHEMSADLTTKPQRRGYPDKLVQAAADRVSAMDRQQVLRYVPKPQTSQRVPFIITHNPTHTPLASWLKHLMPTLHQSRRMRKAMPLPPIVGKRNCRNLRAFLMPSAPHQPGPQQDPEPGCGKCEAKRCIVCKCHLRETGTFQSVRTGHKYTIRDRVGCKIPNLIYLVDCARCHSVQYVGETGQTLQRFHGHRSDIGTDPAKRKTAGRATTHLHNDMAKKETLVARHFQSQDHTILDLQVTVIELIKADVVAKRKLRERYWRHKLKTITTPRV